MDSQYEVPKTTLYNGSIPTVVIKYDEHFKQVTMFERWGYDDQITNNSLNNDESIVVIWSFDK